MKKALITGVTGQDGAYLAEFLLNKGYEVHGIKRRSSLFNTQRIDHIYEDPHIPDRHLHLHYGDLSDSTNLIRIIQEVQPDEIYNLGAMSHVQVSFEEPEYTANVDGIEFRISGWIREGKNGKFISGSVQLKETQGEVRSAPAVEGADEDVPF